MTTRVETTATLSMGPFAKPLTVQQESAVAEFVATAMRLGITGVGIETDASVVVRAFVPSRRA